MADVDESGASHIGICVTDLDRSLRFYCDGLGFTATEQAELGNELAGLLEVDADLAATQQFVRRGQTVLSLMCFDHPEPVGRPSSTRRQLGLTFLAFTVTDLEASVDRLVEHGGTLVASTRTQTYGVDMVFVADPDGTRIELLQMPSAG